MRPGGSVESWRGLKRGHSTSIDPAAPPQGRFTLKMKNGFSKYASAGRSRLDRQAIAAASLSAPMVCAAKESLGSSMSPIRAAVEAAGGAAAFGGAP